MWPDDFSSLESPLEKLSKIQHYGSPTRLIDLTTNPLNALYFAVEDTNESKNGIVMLYIKAGHEFEDNHTRLLSLLAIEKEKKVENLKKRFRQIFGEDITKDDILKYAGEPIFLKHCEELKKANERLHAQEGAFFLCSNRVKENEITKDIVGLCDVVPTMVIRIPYEYKAQIKAELDVKYGINEMKIYPEITSSATYIREKYISSEPSIEGKYRIVEEEDCSTGVARRQSIFIVLNESISDDGTTKNEDLTIESMKRIIRTEVAKKRGQQDAMWFYMAKSNDDYIAGNWIIRGQWVSPTLDERFRPIPLKSVDNDGFSWVYSNSYSIKSEFNDKFYFDEDVNLYAYNKKAYDMLREVFLELKELHPSLPLSDFREKVKSREDNIRRCTSLFGDFGQSRNKQFNDFLERFQAMASEMNSLVWAVNQDRSPENLKALIMMELERIGKPYKEIESGLPVWKEALKITDDDIDKIEYPKRKKVSYKYVQTIPVSEDATDVFFQEKVEFLHNKTVKIGGKTNLFDDANLMLAIKRLDGKYNASGNTSVSGGEIKPVTFSNKGNGLSIGKYKGTITLPLPTSQPKNFVKRAGIEYENLKGQYIIRNEGGVSGKYCFEFDVL